MGTANGMACIAGLIRRRPFIWLLVIVSSGCASGLARGPVLEQGTTMPSPDGCFMQVWAASGFVGTFDYINGPRSYGNLRDLPGGRLWNRRIHSLKVGPAANMSNGC